MRHNYLLVLFLTILFPIILLAKESYIAVFDAGSSSTKVYIYRTTPSSSIQIDQLEHNIKVEPGISSFADSLTGLPNNLKPLAELVKTAIPDDWQNVAVLFRATAGVRLLPKSSQDQILTTVRKFLVDSGFKNIDARVIDGQTEGVLAWLAANYLAGNFAKSTPYNRTLGIVELGGASLQIAFALPNASKRFGRLITLPNAQYNIYSKSYDGLGIAEARKKFINPESCFSPGINGKTTSGNFGSCKRDILRKLDNWGDCDECGIHGEYQPHINKSMPFLGLGALATTSDELQFRFNTSDTREQGSKVCETPIRNVQTISSKAKEKFATYYCFDMAYIATVLWGAEHGPKKFDGLGFQTSHAQVTPALQLNGKAISWTLGAAIMKALEN